MQSRDDEIINIQHGKDLFAAARPPHSFIAMTDNHNHSFNRASNRELLLGYLDRLELLAVVEKLQAEDSLASGKTTGSISH